MKEYIEREALLKLQYNSSEMANLLFENMVVDVSDIENAPAADVVEVVRCEKCSHWNNDIPYHEEYGSCEKYDFEVFHRNDFCSYGERKMDGKDV